jgi:hypothetical protein
MKLAAAFLALVVLSSAALAQDAPPLSSKDVSVKFKRPPQLFFPENAQQGGIHGSATVLCTISKEGSLSDCVVVEEDRKGQHFGDAARKIAGVTMIALAANDGSATPGRKFLLRIVF